MNNNACIGVIIPAAGSGSRMGGVYKPLEKLCGKQMLFYSLDTFQNCSDVGFVVISAREDKVNELTHLCQEYGYSKVKKILCGGSTRQQSVKNAFECGLFDDENITHVAIHDAARPLFSSEMASKVFAMAIEKKNAVCASRVRDTVKKTNDDSVVSDGVDRDNLWLIQTPQVFEKHMYEDALEKAEKEGFAATDDSSLVAQNGVNVNLCETPPYNIKITYPEDVFLAEAIIEKRG